DHLAAEPGDPHLETLEVGHAVDLPLEPARHLRAGAPARARNQAEGLVDFLPEVEPSALVEPGVHSLGAEAIRHRAEPLAGGRLPGPVVCRAVRHLDLPADRALEP